MNQLQTKSFLENTGWKCKPCNCPGAKSYDCLHADHKGITIKLKPVVFRIINKGLTVASGTYPKFQETITKHELDKKTV